jgi:P27 family predicted phage terminase small subunit
MTKGRRGRDPLTDSQRRALGRPPKRKDLDKVPGLSVPVSLPDPPEQFQLEPLALEEWNRVGKFLLFTRRVSQLDRQSLAAYCVSWAAYGDAIRPLLIGRQPLYGHVNGKPRPSKLEEVARNHAAIVISMARRFGMTARTRHLDHADTGRPALPDELHELRGNPSKKQLKTPLAEYTVGGWSAEDIAMPGWFDRVAMEEWQRLTEAYVNINMFTPLDYSTLAIACATWSLYLKATEQASEQGLIALTDKGAAVEHPLSLIQRRQLDILKEIWIDYGMTPLDRRRFKHSGSGDGEQKKRFKVYLGEG